MKTIYITFGERHRYEDHPTFPEADPDGYLTVVGPDEDACLTYAITKLRGEFSMSYTDPEKWNPESWYPKGCLKTWEVPDEWPRISVVEAYSLVRLYLEELQ